MWITTILGYRDRVKNMFVKKKRKRIGKIVSVIRSVNVCQFKFLVESNACNTLQKKKNRKYSVKVVIYSQIRLK